MTITLLPNTHLIVYHGLGFGANNLAIFTTAETLLLEGE